MVAEEQFGWHNLRIPNEYREIFRREDRQYTSDKKEPLKCSFIIGMKFFYNL